MLPDVRKIENYYGIKIVSAWKSRVRLFYIAKLVEIAYAPLALSSAWKILPESRTPTFDIDIVYFTPSFVHRFGPNWMEIRGAV